MMNFFGMLLGLFLITAQYLPKGYGSTTSPIQTKKDALKNHLQNFFSRNRHEATSPQEKLKVAGKIETYFNSLKSNLPSYLMSRVEITKQSYTSGGTNIVLTIIGNRFKTSSDEILVIGAHYDSQRNSPGVNDNGSGMAALLEIARVLVNTISDAVTSPLKEFENSVVLVAFDQNEVGLIGSREFVSEFVKTTLLHDSQKNFQGAIILDTLINFDATPNSQKLPFGFELVFSAKYQEMVDNNHRGDFLLTITRQEDSSLGRMIDEEWYSLVGGDFKTTNKYRHMTFTLPFSGSPLNLNSQVYNYLIDFFQSDHYEFWTHNSSYSQVGLKAVFLSDSASFRGYMEQCYQNPCDNMSYVTDERLEFLQYATESIVRVSKKISVKTSVSSNTAILEVNLGLMFALFSLKLVL